MHDKPFADRARQWLDDAIAWDQGDEKNKEDFPFYWQYAGNPPDPDYYRPEWTEEPTHYQMYEDTSEGTPISPVFASPEEVARWCADNRASAMGGMTATYEQWLEVARGAWAPSMVVQDGHVVSGVEVIFQGERA